MKFPKNIPKTITGVIVMIVVIVNCHEMQNKKINETVMNPIVLIKFATLDDSPSYISSTSEPKRLTKGKNINLSLT
jgi:hypothetical protein